MRLIAAPQHAQLVLIVQWLDAQRLFRAASLDTSVVQQLVVEDVPVVTYGVPGTPRVPELGKRKKYSVKRSRFHVLRV